MAALIRAHHGVTPSIAASAFVAETAVVIGDVEIGEQASIWYGCVLRGDRRSPELMLIDSDLSVVPAEPLLAESDPALADIPVITLSAVAGAGDGIGKVAHGAQDCIRKPFEPRFLVWRVEHALEMHAARTRKAAIDGETASVRSLLREHVPLRSIG